MNVELILERIKQHRENFSDGNELVKKVLDVTESADGIAKKQPLIKYLKEKQEKTESPKTKQIIEFIMNFINNPIEINDTVREKYMTEYNVNNYILSILERIYNVNNPARAPARAPARVLKEIKDGFEIYFNSLADAEEVGGDVL